MLTLIVNAEHQAQDDVLKNLLNDLGEGLSITSIDPEQVTQNLIKGLLETRGLFDDIHVVIVRGGFSKKESSEIFAPVCNLFTSSPHHWFFLEHKITKENKRIFEKSGATIYQKEEIGVVSKKKGGDKTLFAISDAVGLKDKKVAWLLYRKTIQEGYEPEEILNILRWMFRSLYLVEQNDSSELHSFVAGKMKTFLKKYSHNEILASHSELVSLFHRGHRGEPLEYTLERFIISGIGH